MATSKKAIKKNDVKSVQKAVTDIKDMIPELTLKQDDFKEQITLDDVVEVMAKLSKQIGVIEEVLISKGIYVPGMEVRKLSQKNEAHLRMLRERMHKENEIE